MKRVKGKSYCPHAGRAGKPRGRLLRKTKHRHKRLCVADGKTSDVVAAFYGLEPRGLAATERQQAKKPKIRRTVKVKWNRPKGKALDHTEKQWKPGINEPQWRQPKGEHPRYLPKAGN